MSAAISVARSLVPILPSEFDSDPWLLNLLNGTIDLRTDEFRPHDPGDLITHLAPVLYNPEATCPNFEQLEKDIFKRKVGLIDYSRRMAGLFLTGITKEQEIYIFWGEGGNGKNVWYEEVMAILGDYSTIGDPKLLLATDSEQHPTGLAKCEGKRLVVVSEVDDGRVLAEAMVKRITGDQWVTARKMHRDFYDFRLTAKFAVMTNHRLQIPSGDHSIWRRINLVPFEATFLPASEIEEKKIACDSVDYRPIDPDLKQKLAGERSGILNLFLRGFRDWRDKGGMRPPEEVVSATQSYRSEMDLIGEWISDCCTLAADMETPARGLYESYRHWMGARYPKRTLLSSNGFGRELTKRQLPIKHESRANLREGIGLGIDPPQNDGGELSSDPQERIPYPD